MKIRWIVVVAAAMAVAACAGEAPAPAPDPAVVAEAEWRPLLVDEMTEAQKAQMDRGLQTQRSVAQMLMAELMAALDEGGPEAAIAVCHDRATQIAVDQANTSGVFVGRTSNRLRNSANQTPEWAEETVTAGVAEAVFMAGPGGQLGGLTPIVLKAECAMCHGTAEEIDEDLALRISEIYPEDQATGFAAGDLRGWFWFEVPAA